MLIKPPIGHLWFINLQLSTTASNLYSQLQNDINYLYGRQPTLIICNYQLDLTVVTNNKLQLFNHYDRA